MTGKEKLVILGVSLVWAVVWLGSPAMLRAETGDITLRSLDAWRESFGARLDRDLTQLRAAPGSESASAPAADRSHDEGTIRPSEFLPQLAVGRREVWLPAVVAILYEHGLPAELVGVAAVESGFDPAALSHKGARGLWQFMPETARRYGLLVEPRRDDRLDPIKSTFAAARYFQDLYSQFRDWPLALAAYNAGEELVRRSLDRQGARDFWTLSRRVALPEETRRYVPAVLSRMEAPFGPPGSLPSEVSFPSREPLRARSSVGRGRVVYALASPAF